RMARYLTRFAKFHSPHLPHVTRPEPGSGLFRPHLVQRFSSRRARLAAFSRRDLLILDFADLMVHPLLATFVVGFHLRIRARRVMTPYHAICESASWRSAGLETVLCFPSLPIRAKRCSSPGAR